MWLPGVTAVVGLVVGAALQYYSARSLERRRQFEDKRSKAYTDFVEATAALGVGQQIGERDRITTALTNLTDAKIRIFLYGSTRVVESLAEFCRTDQRLDTPIASQTFISLLRKMRGDTAERRSKMITEHDIFSIITSG